MNLRKQQLDNWTNNSNTEPNEHVTNNQKNIFVLFTMLYNYIYLKIKLSFNKSEDKAN